MRMNGQRWPSFCPDKSVASDFGTPRSHEINDESGVISKVDVSGVLCYMDSSTNTTGHDDGWWF